MRPVVPLLVAGLVLVPSVATGHAGQFGDGTLDFGLTDEGRGMIGSDHFVMHAERTGEGGAVPLTASNDAVWASQRAVIGGGDVAGQEVRVDLRLSLASGVEEITVGVGTWSSASGFVAQGQTTKDLAPGMQDVLSFLVPIEAHTADHGDHLAIEVRIDQLGANTGIAVIDTGPASAVHYSKAPPDEG